MGQGMDDKEKKPPPRCDLRDLYASPKALEIGQDLELLRSGATAFAAQYRGQLSGLEGAALAEAIAGFEDLVRCAARLQSFAVLTQAADCAESAFAQNLITQVRLALKPAGFFTAEINDMKEAALLEKMAAPQLAAWGYWLGRVRSCREHQLDAALEQYLEDKAAGAEKAWAGLQDMTLAAMRFELGGNTLTAVETQSVMTGGADKAARHAAFDAFTQGLEEKKEIFTLIFNTLAHLKGADDARRGFEGPEDGHYLSSRIAPATAGTLIETARAASPATAHRYYEWKARKNGVARLHPADRNAPLSGEGCERTYTWDEAKAIVLEAFEKFSPAFAQQARRFFDEGWIDAAPRAGKATGAFALPTVPEAHPYIFMNFTGTQRDVQVLARELGHGIHQLLAAEQGLFGAEVAAPLLKMSGILAETLVFRHRVAQEQDPRVRRSMLTMRIENMLDTMIGQTAFLVFEQRFHAERREKGEVSAARISALWLEAQRESLGPFINLDAAGAGNLWMGVPYFVQAPLSASSDIFGNALGHVLGSALEKTADTAVFAAKYLDLMRAGGTRNHDVALKDFGLDLRRADFWAEGFAALGRDIDALIRLDRQIGDTPERRQDFNAAAGANDNALSLPTRQKKQRSAKPSGPAAGG